MRDVAEKLPPVRAERTGWRDEALSRRHRAWGYHCPAADLDFLLVEYDSARPVALIEYKHERAPKVSTRSTTVQALRVLADNSRIPLLYVRYASDFSWFRVLPLNSYGESLLKTTYPAYAELDERSYVRLLHDMRKRAASES